MRNVHGKGTCHFTGFRIFSMLEQNIEWKISVRRTGPQGSMPEMLRVQSSLRQFCLRPICCQNVRQFRNGRNRWRSEAGGPSRERTKRHEGYSVAAWPKEDRTEQLSNVRECRRARRKAIPGPKHLTEEVRSSSPREPRQMDNPVSRPKTVSSAVAHATISKSHPPKLTDAQPFRRSANANSQHPDERSLPLDTLTTASGQTVSSWCNMEPIVWRR